MIEDLKRLVKHSTIYSIGNILMRVGSFILLPLYTHYLTVGEYGILELTYSVSSIVSTFLSIGLAHATLRFYFEYDDLKDRKSTITTGFIASLLITIPSVVLLSLFSKPLSQLLFDSEKYALALNLTYVILVMEMSRQIGLAYMRAKEYSILFVIVSLVQLVVQVGCNVYTVAYLKAGVNGVLTGNMISVFAGLLICTFLIVKECGFRFDFLKLKEMLTYSYPFLLSAISNAILQNADRFIIKSLISVEAVGIYALAEKFGILLKELVIEPFQRSFGAFRFSVMKQENSTEIQTTTLNYLLFIVTWVALGIALFSSDIIDLMTTPQYYSASIYIPLLLLSHTISSCGYVFQTGILYQKKTINLFYINLCTGVFGLINSFFFIKFFGLFGMCVASVIFSFSSVCLTNYFSQKLFRVNYEYNKIVSIILIATLLLLTGYILPISNIFISILVKGTILLSFLFFTIKIKFFSHEELNTAIGFLITKLKLSKKIAQWRFYTITDKID